MTEDERFLAAIRDLERLGSSLLASQSRRDQQQFRELLAFDSTAFDALAFDAEVTSEQSADLHRSCLAALDLVATWINPVEPETWAEHARLQVEFNKYRPAHQRGQATTTNKRRRARATFVDKVDAERAKSDEMSLRDAIIRVLKRTGVPRRTNRYGRPVVEMWSGLTAQERTRAVRVASRRYVRGKRQAEPSK